MLEDLALVRGFGKLIGQVLTREMLALVEARPPLGAIAHIVDDSLAGDPQTRAALTCVAAEFVLRDDTVGNQRCQPLCFFPETLFLNLLSPNTSSVPDRTSLPRPVVA